MSELDTEPATNKTTTTNETLTEYVVLSLNSGSWFQQAVYRNRTGDGAIRDHLYGIDEPSGTYVAVPARSWKPVTVKAEQTVTLKLEQAT